MLTIIYAQLIDIEVGLSANKGGNDEAIWSEHRVLCLRDYDRADGDLDECVLGDLIRFIGW